MDPIDQVNDFTFLGFAVGDVVATGLNVDIPLIRV
jgi:hypothetical protein